MVIWYLTELAQKVKEVGDELGLNVEIRNTENPRMELEEHYYKPDHQNLLNLGYKPTHDMRQEVRILFNDLLKYRKRIEARNYALLPDIHWDGTRRKVKFLT